MSTKSRKSSISTAATSHSGVQKSFGGRSVDKNSKMNSIAHKKLTYGNDGRVQDDVNAEEKIKLAIKAKATRRRKEVVEIKTKPATASTTSKAPFKVPRIEKNPENYKLIKDALEKNILFNDCTDDQLNTIILALKPKKIAQNTKLITEGDEGYNFYVVQKGDFEFSKNGKVIGQAHGGDSFGELALLYYAPRAVTVTATTMAEVWKLDKATFRQILDTSNEVKAKKMREALRQCSIFEDFKDEDIEQIVDIAHYQTFKAGDVIIRKGDTGNLFYVMVGGRVQVTKAGDIEELGDTIYETGDYFGERALITGEARAANVIAIEDCDVLVLDKQSFDQYLGNLIQLLDHNFGMRVLQSVELLQQLTHENFNELCEELKAEEFHKDSTIVRQGDHGSKFYIIKFGQVKVEMEQPDGVVAHVADLGTGSYFGEFALLNDEPRQCSVIAKTDCSLFSLEREVFERLFGPLEGMKEKAKQRKSQLTDLNRSASHISIQSTQSSGRPELLLGERIPFENLRFLATLGTGTFGRVKLVQNIKSGDTFALKILQKQQIVQYRQQANVMNEKKVMRQSDHPFILKLYETYRDKDCLYMLLELVQGGELFTLLHLQPKSRFSNQHARFYAACVIDALHYLHDRHIVYRDLKPENLMIDTQGYIRVVDFGFAKVVKQKTYTLCGTPEYLAPELVLQKGHNRAVDYWAVGVLIFEMLNGQSPFADPKRNEQIAICRNIVRLKYDFPKKFPTQARSLVMKLLKRPPHERLGMAKNGTQDIKDHPWFEQLNWEMLYNKQLVAPWVPNIADKLDISNFEPYEEEDDILKYTDDGTNWEENF